jgi:hypothetical protein
VGSDQSPGRHRGAEPHVPLPGRGAVLYLCVLLGSGGSSIRYIAAHDEAWWWLKALIGAGIFGVMAVVGLRVWRSLLSRIWAELVRQAK